MNTEPVYLYAALLDVLAYRHHLEEDRKLGTLQFHKKLATALAAFDSVNEAIFRVQSISDTIIVTCTDHSNFPKFLLMLRDVFIAFLREGLFVRGGIAYSRHFQRNHVTYSHAVARAYELESQVAIYPRIVIDENILKMYESGTGLPNLASAGLICKENGVFFVDVLTKSNWAEVNKFVVTMYKASADQIQGNESVLNKFMRFEKYMLRSPHANSNAQGFVAGIEQM
jgi:hypothetical protein